MNKIKYIDIQGKIDIEDFIKDKDLITVQYIKANGSPCNDKIMVVWKEAQ
jgi:hypothetical protein